MTSADPNNQPGLYGIVNSNRVSTSESPSVKSLWGKNEFNSTFPIALANYMFDLGIPAVYIRCTRDNRIKRAPIPISTLYGTSAPLSHLHFAFETSFAPFVPFSSSLIDRVDVVVGEVKQVGEGLPDIVVPRRGLEVKLTVVPDNTTCELPYDRWAPELVARPATTQHCLLSMAHALSSNFDSVRKELDPVCEAVRDWSNPTEVLKLLPRAVQAMATIANDFWHLQSPILMQPIWRTDGKSPTLSENTFDIFVWSDFAFWSLIAEKALRSYNPNKPNLSRPCRAALRMTRGLFDISSRSRAHLSNIWKTMTYDNQSDKELSIQGTETHAYMRHRRLEKPRITKNTLKKIITNGGEKLLSPERRFDASIFFTAMSLFANQETVE